MALLLVVGAGGLAWRQQWNPTRDSSGPEPAMDGAQALTAQAGPSATLPGTNRIETVPETSPRGQEPPGPGPTLWDPTSERVARPVSDILEAQIALASHGISVGSIDGVLGSQTSAALTAFQLQQALEQTGRLDPATRSLLRIRNAAATPYTLTEADLAGLASNPEGWWNRSQATGLPHETLLERLAERTHAHPKLLRQLNPTVDWDRATAGTQVAVPTTRFPPPVRAALIRISLSHRHLRAFDTSGNLIAHFPCSIGRIAGTRPIGDLHVVTVVANPNYTFDPRNFPESAEGRRLGRRLIIPPGPNNPVGVAWIGLDRPGFGIHGTPSPEQVGRTESHGCFRLANWNAEQLRQMVWTGLRVSVEP